MAPRAYWKGHIKLALVSFPVRLYAAVTSTDRISLHRIHRESGERVRMQNYVEGQGPVERDDIVMGYEYERDHYIPVEEDELEALDVDSKHTIDLSRFVELSSIDPIYFDKPYYVAPDGDIATEAFVTIRDGLRAAGKVALGQIVLSKRERVVAIQPCGKGLLLETLRWADEVREPSAYFEEIEEVSVSKDQIEMAETLIEARSGEFQPETFKDRYQAELRSLIEAKLKGKRSEATISKAAPKSNVINLMDALKASLDENAGGKTKKKPQTAKSSTGTDAPTKKASAKKAPTEKAAAEKAAAKTPARRTRAKSGEAPRKKPAEAKPRQRKSA